MRAKVAHLRRAVEWYTTVLGFEVESYGRPIVRTTRPLGAARPHAGGWFAKTLNAPLYIHYAATLAFESAEQAMLDAFAAATSIEARVGLQDPARPIPYANMRWLGHGRKQHGIDGARD